MKPACGTCRYWLEDDPEDDSGAGECRRFPPAVRQCWREWPSVCSIDWCGEYEMKEQKSRNRYA